MFKKITLSNRSPEAFAALETRAEESEKFESRRDRCTGYVQGGHEDEEAIVVQRFAQIIFRRDGSNCYYQSLDVIELDDNQEHDSRARRT